MREREGERGGVRGERGKRGEGRRGVGIQHSTFFL